MKSHLAQICIALLSTAVLLGCQGQGSDPVGPEGVGPQFAKKDCVADPTHPGCKDDGGGVTVGSIELTPTNLSLATPLGEDTRRDLVYASPGRDLLLDLFLPVSGATLVPLVLDGDGNPVSGVTLTWSSTNTSVATVSSAGLVSATGIGSATITASGDGVTSDPVTATVSGGPFPAIVYLHGGGWQGGDKTQFEPQATDMAAAGFVGATIEYRLVPEGVLFPAPVEDSKAAVRWLRANASTYRIDAGRIGVAGRSAGGHLAAMLGTTLTEFEGNGGNPSFSSRVQAVAAFNGVFDFVALNSPKFKAEKAIEGIANFLGASYEEDPELWVTASPITHVGTESAPFLFLHGTRDKLIPYQQSVDMMNALTAAGVSAEIFTAKGAGHTFFIDPPWYQLTLDAMEEFFTRKLQ